MGKVLATLSAGVTAGLFLAFAGTAVVGSYLYGVTPRDPLSFARPPRVCSSWVRAAR
jgi:hypothetical protein